jgi:pilus assembly protein CpaC
LNGEELPAPEAGAAFTPDQFRLPLMGGVPRAGTTPRPTREVQQKFDQFIERTIDPESTLDLVVQRPRLLLFKQAPIRVQIADENIAAYTLISETELSVVGNDVGSTVLNLWFADPAQPNQPRILSYLVRVIPDPEEKERLDRVYQALQGEINQSFPNSAVRLTLVGDKLVVSGEAKDIVEAAQILRVVSANAPGAGRGDDEASQIPVGQLNVTAVPDELGNLPQQGLENFLLNEVGRNVINLLHVPGEQQVMLRVIVAEINRSAARSIGLDFSVINKGGDVVFANITAGLIPTTVTGAGSTSQLIGGNLPAIIDNGQVTLAIQALRNLNFARSMAEPNLVTLNGQPAFFRAGGEFPVPAAAVTFGAAAQGVRFVPFGVQLTFIPYVTDRDRVRLQVMSVVSTRDPSLGTNIASNAGSGSTSVSGLQSRVFRSTVELREGQTLAVAGLIQNNFGATTVRVPLFGDLPIVGSLFGKNSVTQAEQEVVVLVTPELVHPLPACQTPPLPGADVFEPGDVEFYLLNRLESRRSVDFRSSVRTDWKRLVRYQHCDDAFILGAHGQSFNCCPGAAACNLPAGAFLDDEPTQASSKGAAVSPAAQGATARPVNVATPNPATSTR